MKLIIHPGHGKCGSSSIQGWIRKNMECLSDNGYVVPGRNMKILNDSKSFDVTSMYILDIVNNKAKNSFESDLKTLTQEIGNSDRTVLWSDEFLTSHVIIDGGFIHETIRKHIDDAKVVYYIRRQDDYILSGWQQWRHKLGRSLEEECSICINEHIPNYLHIIQKLESIYGVDNVVVRFFDRSSFLNGDLIEDFTAISGIHLPYQQKYNSNVNVSLNPYLCDVLSLAHDGLYENNINDTQVKKWLENHLKSGILHEPHKDFMKKELRRRVMAHFYEENLKLHQKYFPELEFDRVFGEKHMDTHSDELKRLKEIVALQFELIYALDKKITGKNRIIKNASLQGKIISKLKRLLKK